MHRHDAIRVWQGHVTIFANAGDSLNVTGAKMPHEFGLRLSAKWEKSGGLTGDSKGGTTASQDVERRLQQRRTPTSLRCTSHRMMQAVGTR